MSILPVAPDQYDRHNEQTTRSLLEDRLVNVERSTATTAGDAVLQALSDYDTNGLVTQTATATFTGRTITGTANQITVTNGNGVSGNPTLSLPADVVVPTVITAPNTGLHILDTNASHDLIVKPGSDLSADRTLTVTTGDADRTLDISAGSVTITAAGAAILDDADAGAQRTTLGVGTGDSPQFTAINLGHASDTTLTRTGAGDAAIEGNAIYRAGGTDVPVTDGGTGASTAASARTNLGVGSALLSSGSVGAAAATIDWDLTSYGSTYRAFVLRLSLAPATDVVNLMLRFSTDGGSTFDAGASDYEYSAYRVNTAGTITGAGSTGATHIQLNAGSTLGNASEERTEYEVTVWRPASVVNTVVTWSGGHISSAAQMIYLSGSGRRLAAQNTDALRVLFSSGDVASGDWALYGLH